MMVASSYDEQPIPPDDAPRYPRYHDALRRCGKLPYFVMYLLILIMAISGIAYLTNTSDQAENEVAQYNKLLVRFEKLEESYSVLKQIHANREVIEQDINEKITTAMIQIRDINTELTKKKRLVDVPLALMVSAEVAHDLMTNGYVMREEYRAFAATVHNMAVDEMVRQFMQQTPRPVIFNLHYINQINKVRFTRITPGLQSVNMTFESSGTDIVCKYADIKSSILSSQYDELFLLNMRCDDRPQCRWGDWTGETGPMINRIAIAQTC